MREFVPVWIQGFVHTPFIPAMVFGMAIIHAAGLQGTGWRGLGVFVLLLVIEAWFWLAGLAAMSYWEGEELEREAQESQ